MIWYKRLPTTIKTQFKFGCNYCSVTIKEKTIKLDKWNINYIKVGKGPHHVFCMPGTLGTIWTDFTPQIEGFDKEKFTLVVWDPPGFGKSRPPDKEFTGNFYKKDADYAFQFMKALEIPKYSVLGWSDGGVAAVILAAKYPDSLNKLVLVSTGARVLPESVEFMKKIKDLNKWSKSMRKEMTEIYGDGLSKYFDSWVDGHEGILLNENGNVSLDLLGDIKCPTLVIRGGKDELSPAGHAADFIENIPSARLHVYPEGNHNLHIKYSEDFNKRVQEFYLEP